MIRRFWADRRGATAIEYALIGGIVSLAIVGALTQLGTTLNAKLNAPLQGLQ